MSSSGYYFRRLLPWFQIHGEKHQFVIFSTNSALLVIIKSIVVSVRVTLVESLLTTEQSNWASIDKRFSCKLRS